MILAAFHRANRFDPVFTDLDILLLLPFSVEIVSSEGTLVGICLIVPPTIGALGEVRAGFTLFCFEVRWICFLISLTALPKFAVVLGLVRAISFNAFGTLNST